MMYTFDAVRAEIDYRRELMVGGASRSRLGWLARRRAATSNAMASSRRWKQVRDGTDSAAYDLAA